MRVVVADIDLDSAERVASAARESGVDAIAVPGGRLRPHRDGRARRARLRGVRRGQPALLQRGGDRRDLDRGQHGRGLGVAVPRSTCWARCTGRRPSSRACASRRARRTSSTPPRWPGSPSRRSMSPSTRRASTPSSRSRTASATRWPPTASASPCSAPAGSPAGCSRAIATCRRTSRTRSRPRCAPRAAAACRPHSSAGASSTPCRQGRFWVITHPRERDRVDERYEEIVADFAWALERA